MKKLLLLLLALCSVMLAERASTPSASEALTQGVKQVTVVEAKSLLSQGAIFLDARKPIDISRGKIKGAFKASYKDKGGNTNKIMNWDKTKDSYYDKHLPSNKNVAVVTYCNGPKCWKSYKLAVIMVKDLGYKNVYWMRDGFPAWKEAGNSIE